MRILLLKYNKVTDESFEILAKSLSGHTVITGDLVAFGGNRVDILSFSEVSRYLGAFEPLDVVIIGDVFWPTGQHICRWCTKNRRGKVSCLFLQHGQWVYVLNKKQLRQYPSHTALFGDTVTKICQSWPYGKHSKVVCTGSPRYDPYSPSRENGDYVFFSPPVIQELVHKKPQPVREPFLRALKYISGIDKETKVKLQPHYREARVDMLHDLFPDAEFVHPDEKTLDLVAGSKKVVSSRNSTVVLDAIVCGKVTVFTEFLNCDAAHFHRGSFGEFGRENESRKDFVNNVLSEDVVFFEDHGDRAKPYILMGDSSSRISNLIEGM